MICAVCQMEELSSDAILYTQKKKIDPRPCEDCLDLMTRKKWRAELEEIKAGKEIEVIKPRPPAPYEAPDPRKPKARLWLDMGVKNAPRKNTMRPKPKKKPPIKMKVRQAPARPMMAPAPIPNPIPAHLHRPRRKPEPDPNCEICGPAQKRGKVIGCACMRMKEKEGIS